MVVEVAVAQSLPDLIQDKDDYAVNPEIKLFLGIKVWRRKARKQFAALVFLYDYANKAYKPAFSIGNCQINHQVDFPDGLTLANARPGASPTTANLPTSTTNQAMLDIPTAGLYAHAPNVPQNLPQNITIDLWEFTEVIHDSL